MQDLTFAPSVKLERHLLNKRITELLEDIEKAESHIDLVRTIGEANAVRYYPEDHHRPVRHRQCGIISPMYAKYLYYKKHLPLWQEELKQKYNREKEICKSK